MALSNAEKQRRYREKLKQDPERQKVEKAKRKLLNAKRIKVCDMSSREKRAHNKKNRINVKAHRNRKKMLEHLPPTPPDENSIIVTPPGNKVRGRRVVLKNRSKLNRTNNSLKLEIAQLKMKCEKLDKKYHMYRQRSLRAERRKLDDTPQLRNKTDDLTPQSKAHSDLENRTMYLLKNICDYMACDE